MLAHGFPLKDVSLIPASPGAGVRVVIEAGCQTKVTHGDSCSLDTGTWLRSTRTWGKVMDKL